MSSENRIDRFQRAVHLTRRDAELGQTGLDVSAWFGLLARSATPRAMQDRLSTTILAVRDDANVR